MLLFLLLTLVDVLVKSNPVYKFTVLTLRDIYTEILKLIIKNKKTYFYV